MQIDDPVIHHQAISKVLLKYDIEIDDVNTSHFTLDSRNVQKDGIFVALLGEQVDGKKYINNAIASGAKLVIVDSDDVDLHGYVKTKENIQIVHFYELKNNLGQMVAEYYLNLSKKLMGIAVTGTNGKTSVAHILASLSALTDCAAGTIGTMGVQLYKQTHEPQKISETSNTTPDVISSHQFCCLLKANGAERFCLEASSHGLHQNRLQGLRLTTGIFTNLSQDHLDYHETMEKYAQAKRRLIRHYGLSSLVINADDKEGLAWIETAKGSKDICIYSCAEKRPSLCNTYAYLWATEIRFMHSGCSFLLQSSWGKYAVNLPLIGSFNIYNLLAALAALVIQGESLEKLVKVVAQLSGVPGRMELFESSSHGNIIVDYAHTPDALKQALLSAKQHTMGDLVVVFGCGGDRDNSKRSQMGRVAEKWADIVYLTQDNSRSELPANIIHEIMSGIADESRVHQEVDRKTAIKKAYLNSKNGDLIVVAGKGHEEYIELNGAREYYNERAYVKTLISGKTL